MAEPSEPLTTSSTSARSRAVDQESLILAIETSFACDKPVTNNPETNLLSQVRIP
ncbi:hypothetical protein QCA50_009041 [Cerrena zonata]|uniref:Uncharacterized protein n=1 Tax=Cerrena zonata TaxID=2478898 RepID=A0AAW0GD18_9APHY